MEFNFHMIGLSASMTIKLIQKIVYSILCILTHTDILKLYTFYQYFKI